ncbi:hypothetical protein MKW98_005982 [Papaver atlanticum]|uniref:Zinc finger PHD-type domain-containing protein n=1 Tax=Papaver atlanticum TaxID=357466 RepID=A0AAD4S6G6_9MAGN|nr:hypothetical protein MKW98_005982 [Papaver atlanticum]
MDSLGFLPLSSSSAKGKKFPSKSNRPCHFCGKSASPDICVTCCNCKVSHVHLYCLHKKLATVSEKWYCEECKTLSSFQQELPDQLAINATWKGSFEILDSVLMGGTYEGLQAHLSWKVRRKVYEVANAMPNVLQLKLYPRSDVWPEEFKRLSPTVDDIALYFLPTDNERFRKAYHFLSNVLMTRDSAIQSSLNGFELLIFSSKQLPTNFQRINKHFFLWGVFQSVGKRYSSSQASVRNQLKSVSSALCNNDYGTNNDSPNIIKADDFMAVKMETDIMEENNDQRIDKAALSNSYHEEKKRKLGGDQGPLLTPKTEQPSEFDSPPGFMRPNTSNGYDTNPSLLLGGPPGFTRPNANVDYATSPALLSEIPPGLTPKVEQPGEFDCTPEFMTSIATSHALLSGAPPGFKTPNTKGGYATSSALLMEAPPGFCTPVRPKERGDSSDETNQKLEASDTMDAIALWASKRQRSARGTATGKYNRDSSLQPQKPTKATETPEQAELLLRNHQQVSNHAREMHSASDCKPLPVKVKEEFDEVSKDLILHDTTSSPILLQVENVKDGERWITEVSNENDPKEEEHDNGLKLTLRYDEYIGWRADV